MLVVHETAALPVGMSGQQGRLRDDQRGVTLIELMVGLVIVGILFALAAPNFRDWLQNAQIRSLAGSITDGLQVARSAAVSRNSSVGFFLTSDLTATCSLSATGTNWVVSVNDPTNACNGSSTVAPFVLQSYTSAEGAGNAAISSVAGVSSVVFNGLGRASAMTLTVSNPTGGTCAPGGPMRCMQIDVTPGGRVRMCDPALPTSDPQGCS